MADKPNLLVIGGAMSAPMRDALAEVFTIHKLFDQDDQQAWLTANGADMPSVLTDGHWGVRPEIMKHLPNVKMISCYGVGYDNIDAADCAARGIMVTHTPNVLNAEVANTALLLWLATSRRLVRDDRFVRSGGWLKGSAPLTHSVDDRKVGILGLGRIGEELARRLAVFNADISYHTRNKKPESPYRYYPSLVDLARDVEVLFCITPGGATTHHLVNREVMDALGPDGTLINVGRGPVVDEAEMVKALQDGRLGNAGLDVFEEEPKVPEALFDMDQVTLLPHVGSATIETRKAMGDLAVNNLLQFQREGTVISPVPECQES
ncbi:2-hydroxyacid dehydrogenase [Yoonia sediminilitoris]|uniref:Lactate dehydrogenase-like 2-hydroxyacid dehydrogenase n=1 Tax=Yoonia sediminilitoris TaxID=1286148 RepID=A0A2T6KR71_9RHOB|nr:2-hydroxyacid dehydrogenase [Yoonia sediminilitoris]PUB19050.1 lactate dehydrogenase-like 2-hydroxyacid dehydrogenase [Yoonia sediminilitoris]RCW99218.1 lactate dehydrogenase-like 2-hydroxyacid dehydrogenase [Yoonia sediminilitoris]